MSIVLKILDRIPGFDPNSLLYTAVYSQQPKGESSIGKAAANGTYKGYEDLAL